ncbi:hypothetical protein F5Y18DRAFT_423812 [Xylariaceae sp. FL1019]|nr:hypothetical protein F5Y18DRAFT_423812 [Xylariaceae sp. FL1019]
MREGSSGLRTVYSLSIPFWETKVFELSEEEVEQEMRASQTRQDIAHDVHWTNRATRWLSHCGTDWKQQSKKARLGLNTERKEKPRTNTLKVLEIEDAFVQLEQYYQGLTGSIMVASNKNASFRRKCPLRWKPQGMPGCENCRLLAGRPPLELLLSDKAYLQLDISERMALGHGWQGCRQVLDTPDHESRLGKQDYVRCPDCTYIVLELEVVLGFLGVDSVLLS